MAFSSFLHRDLDYASLPDVIDEELLDKRVTRLRNGDLSVVKDITTSLMRLTMGVVRDSYSSDDELIGEALLILIESVINASTALHDNNIVPYVLKTVRMRLRDLQLEGWMSYSISARRLRDRLSKGQTIPQRNAISEEDIQTDKHFKQTRLRVKNLIDPHTDQAEFELRDSLAKIVRSHRQKAVINLKMEEYTLKEIAEKLEISEATALREIHDLRDRYKSEI